MTPENAGYECLIDYVENEREVKKYDAWSQQLGKPAWNRHRKSFLVRDFRNSHENLQIQILKWQRKNKQRNEYIPASSLWNPGLFQQGTTPVANMDDFSNPS